jgi:site-specific DNA-methyltransferase (adenine-specific)
LADGTRRGHLSTDRIYQGDARKLLDRVRPGSVALSVWSPPYFVGKSYEQNSSERDWRRLLAAVITKHERVLNPGGFLAINIADILCYIDPAMPRIQAENLSGRRLPVTRAQVLAVCARHPSWNRYAIAKLLGVSEQTVDRRLKDNNIRGGKAHAQTRVKLVGGMLEEFAAHAGLYLYDRRVWLKDPAWENSRWHTNSYRAVDEFEYVYIYWKPGITRIDRRRLRADEWAAWGSRGVWHIPSVRANDDHEAKFPTELPRRLIRLLTEPGETVLDCFVGSGTTAVAAIETGRHFIGIESWARYARLARSACKRALARQARVPNRESERNGSAPPRETV